MKIRPIFAILSVAVALSAQTGGDRQARVLKLESSLLAPCCWAEPVSTHRSEVALQMREEIAGFVSQSVVSTATPGSFPWAIATGRTYLENFDPVDDHADADPAFCEFIRIVGMCAVCVVPLKFSPLSASFNTPVAVPLAVCAEPS